MPLADLKFVEAYRASNLAQAHIIRMALEAAGLRVLIEGESLQDGGGEIPIYWPSAPRLMVEESQLAAARAIISQTDHSERANLGLKPQQTASTVAAAVLGIVGIDPDSETELLPDDTEATHCLACGTLMSESEETCSKCGWSYSETEGLEPYDDEEPDV